MEFWKDINHMLSSNVSRQKHLPQQLTMNLAVYLELNTVPPIRKDTHHTYVQLCSK